MNPEMLEPTSSPHVIDAWARGLVAIGCCSLGAFGVAVGGWPGVLLFLLLLIFTYLVSVGKQPKWRGKRETGNVLWAIVGGGMSAASVITFVEMALT
jgi:hypothetical protein